MNLVRNSKYRQGYFIPRNKEKFIGDKAIYRSGLELSFFRLCDESSNILKWGSESIIVPYISPLDNKIHRYFVDNYIVLKSGDVIKKYLIEIKPHKQTLPPSTKYRKKQHLIYEQKQWIVNNAKWESAREWAKKHGMEFKIITDKDI
jgi:hypothetical protein